MRFNLFVQLNEVKCDDGNEIVTFCIFVHWELFMAKRASTHRNINGYMLRMLKAPNESYNKMRNHRMVFVFICWRQASCMCVLAQEQAAAQLKMWYYVECFNVFVSHFVCLDFGALCLYASVRQHNTRSRIASSKGENLCVPQSSKHIHMYGEKCNIPPLRAFFLFIRVHIWKSNNSLPRK